MKYNLLLRQKGSHWYMPVCLLQPLWFEQRSFYLVFCLKGIKHSKSVKEQTETTDDATIFTYLVWYDEEKGRGDIRLIRVEKYCYRRL